MDKFWNQIDDEYFQETNSNKLMTVLSSSRASEGAPRPQSSALLVSLFSEKAAKVFNLEAFSNFDGEKNRKADVDNFLKHYFVSLKSYKSVLTFVKKQKSPCRKCSLNLLSVLSERFRTQSRFGKSERVAEKLLASETRNLDKLLSRSLPVFCDFCLSLIDEPTNQASEFKSASLIESR